MNTLIPDLPEEIGLQCLIRVHHRTLPLLRRVCRRWKQATESPFFHRLRRSSGSSHPLIIFSQATNLPQFFSSLPSFRLVSFDRFSGEWSPLPPIPFSPRSIPQFCGLAASNHHLVVIGGWSPETFYPSSAVYVYSFLSGTWTRGAPMPFPTRSFFASAASTNNQVFVAGGRDEKRNELKSGMVYDVAKQEWTALPAMPRERDQCSGVFVDGKAGGVFVVVDDYCTSMQGRYERSPDVFDVVEWRWQCQAAEEEAVDEDGWTSCRVAEGDGRVYMCGGGGTSVVVKEGEEWREVAELPEDVRWDSRMVGWGGGLMVVGAKGFKEDLAAYVLEMKEGTAVGWRRVEVPKEYSGNVERACCIDV